MECAWSAGEDGADGGVCADFKLRYYYEFRFGILYQESYKRHCCQSSCGRRLFVFDMEVDTAMATGMVD